MAHALFGERFLDNRAPEWHRLGVVCLDPLNAEEAFERVGGYEVELVPLVAADESVIVRERVIVRRPTADDPESRVLGIVGPNWELLSPRDFVQAWDRAIDVPVETLAVMKEGAVIIVSTRMPDFDIAGDEMNNYLLAYNGMSGKDALRFDITPVRAVCMNTTVYAQAVARESLVLPHTKASIAEFESSLKEAFMRAGARAAAIKEAGEILAAACIDLDAAKEATEKIYPVRRRPSDFGPKLIVETRMHQWEMDRSLLIDSRDSVIELFNGAGAGMDSPAAAGTAWGLYNAVVEFEDYRGHRANAEQRAESALVGVRAANKALAFDVCHDLALSLN